MLSLLISRGAFRHVVSLPRRRERLHVMPTSTGLETAYGGSYDWDGQQRGNTPFSILQHTISGGGRLRYESADHRIGPGETMLVTIPHRHRYWVEPGESWTFFWIAMTGQEAIRLHGGILATAGPVFRLRDETIGTLARICLELATATQSGQASSLAYAATMALHDDLLVTHESAPTFARQATVNRVRAHILRNLERLLDIDTLARVAGMSRAHFSRIFTQVEGISPSEFVMRERLRRATRLLLNAELTIKEISSVCGFDDPNYFAKVFRRYFEVSPTDFRSTGMYLNVEARLRPQA
jgi:AraC-like DNA-binding protein